MKTIHVVAAMVLILATSTAWGKGPKKARAYWTKGGKLRVLGGGIYTVRRCWFDLPKQQNRVEATFRLSRAGRYRLRGSHTTRRLKVDVSVLYPRQGARRRKRFQIVRKWTKKHGLLKNKTRRGGVRTHFFEVRPQDLKTGNDFILRFEKKKAKSVSGSVTVVYYPLTPEDAQAAKDKYKRDKKAEDLQGLPFGNKIRVDRLETKVKTLERTVRGLKKLLHQMRRRLDKIDPNGAGRRG